VANLLTTSTIYNVYHLEGKKFINFHT